MKPPFQPKVDSSADDALKFFNTEKDTSALVDTYIPRENKNQVKQMNQQDAFAGFDSKKSKK